MFVFKALHVLSAVIWVGGMFFAFMCLRPVAASLLEPPVRLKLWSQTFTRFFPWVWLTIILLLVSGHGMIMRSGGISGVGAHVHLMMASGYTMIVLFMHVFFAPYRRLKHAVTEGDWPAAARHLNLIRRIVAINIILGMFTVTLGAGLI